MELKINLVKKIKKLHSDKGTEYDSRLFNEFYKQHGIVHETTATYSPEMNGKEKRKSITLTELVVAIMLILVLLLTGRGNFVDGLLCPE